MECVGGVLELLLVEGLGLVGGCCVCWGFCECWVFFL